MPRSPSIDRSEASPCLVNCYLSPSGTHQPMAAYRNPSPAPASIIQLYTWLDASLQSLTLSLFSAKPLNISNSKVSIKHVYWDPELEAYVGKEVALLSQKDLVKSSSEVRGAGAKTLDNIGFVIGDYLDFCFISNQPLPHPGGAASQGGRPLGRSRMEGQNSSAPAGAWGRGPPPPGGMLMRPTSGAFSADAERW